MSKIERDFVHTSKRLPKRFRNPQSAASGTPPGQGSYDFLFNLSDAVLKRFVELCPADLLFKLSSSNVLFFQKSLQIQRPLVVDHLTVYQDDSDIYYDVYIQDKMIKIKNPRKFMEKLKVNQVLKIGNVDIAKNILVNKLPKLNYQTLVLLGNFMTWDSVKHLITPSAKNVKVIRWSHQNPPLAEFLNSFLYCERIMISIFADPELNDQKYELNFPCPIDLLNHWMPRRVVPLKHFYLMYGKDVLGYQRGRFKHAKKYGRDVNGRYQFLPINDPIINSKDEYSYMQWTDIFI